jgi:hypothetical protein
MSARMYMRGYSFGLAKPRDRAHSFGLEEYSI